MRYIRRARSQVLTGIFAVIVGAGLGIGNLWAQTPPPPACECNICDPDEECTFAPLEKYECRIDSEGDCDETACSSSECME